MSCFSIIVSTDCVFFFSVLMSAIWCTTSASICSTHVEIALLSTFLEGDNGMLRTNIHTVGIIYLGRVEPRLSLIYASLLQKQILMIYVYEGNWMVD